MSKLDKKLQFGVVQVRLYEMTLGNNPSVSIGPPISLGDDFEALEEFSVEKHERLRSKYRRKPQSHQLTLNYYQRYEILHGAGFNDKEIQAAERNVSWDRTKRNASYFYCYHRIFLLKARGQWNQRHVKMTLRRLQAGSSKRS